MGFYHQDPTDAVSGRAITPSSVDSDSVNTDDLNIDGDVSATLSLISATNATGDGQIAVQETTGVEDTATVIFGSITGTSNDAQLVFVSGFDGVDGFMDLIAYTNRGNNHFEWHSSDINSPGVRTYNVNAGNLEVSLSAGSYNISAVGFRQKEP